VALLCPTKPCLPFLLRSLILLSSFVERMSLQVDTVLGPLDRSTACNPSTSQSATLTHLPTFYTNDIFLTHLSTFYVDDIFPPHSSVIIHVKTQNLRIDSFSGHLEIIISHVCLPSYVQADGAPMQKLGSSNTFVNQPATSRRATRLVQ
jgi:hypothetical protein